ncbi:MAG: CIA30 family protein [Pseudomonadota bacterium]
MRIPFFFLALALFSISVNADLDKAMISEWASIDDSVMGGLSQSSMREEEGKYVFSGNVSLQNNGGFASVRSGVRLSNVSDDATVYIKVKGDGRKYQLRFRMRDDFDGVSYTVAFKTTKDHEIERTFRLQDFIPVWRGKRVSHAPSLRWQDVNQIGFMVTDKQQGQFRLEVNEVNWLNGSS